MSYFKVHLKVTKMIKHLQILKIMPLNGNEEIINSVNYYCISYFSNDNYWYLFEYHIFLSA